MNKKISVNQKICIGCGYCTACASDIFELGEDFKSRLKDDGRLKVLANFELSPDQLDKIKEVVSGCPERAIEIV